MLALSLLAAAYVNVDVGRQLFVDNHLVETTSLERVWHQPAKYEANPVLKPETPWEINPGGNSATVPKGGGIWWDDSEKIFKLWYEGGWLNSVCYATSKDGINWSRPSLSLYPGTNIVLPTNQPHYKPDSWSVVMDPHAKNPAEKFKLLLSRPHVEPHLAPHGVLCTSPDGINWKEVSKLPPVGDRSSLFYNPFREKWVFSIRSNWKHKGEKHGRRNRMYAETSNFLSTPDWFWECDGFSAEPWLEASPNDLVDPSVADPAKFPRTQLYNFDAVAYESLMLGLFEIHLGPENGECENKGLPKITDVKFGFSRDGKNFFRGDYSAAIPSSRWNSGKWDTGYVQPVANGCVVMGDELWFYYGAFRGEPARANSPSRKFHWAKDNGMYANGAMGIAKLRRDGFASLSGTGEVLTRHLHFSGEFLFVNVDAKNGSFAAELLDSKGNVVPGFSAADSLVSRIDSTRHRVAWKNKDRLDVMKWHGHRLRFKLENAHLYSFWISMDDSGASNGWLAGGGPGYASLRDTPKYSRPAIPPKIFPPDPAHAISTRRHEGIPSLAVSPKGRMWASWYGGKTPYEDEHNYLVLTTSSDNGDTWTEHLICDPDGEGPRRVFDPELWISPDGKLRWTWTDKIGPVMARADDDQLWMATLDPESGAILEPPRKIARGVMMNKPTVLKDGTWIFPAAHWWQNPSACCYASTDGGKTFNLRGGVTIPHGKRGYDEHTIVERSDGSLVCYIRTFNGKRSSLWSATSTDGGFTWSESKPDPMANLSSRTFVTRLASGRWLMVKHDGWRKILSNRTNLAAFLSDDEGRSWQGGLLLDSRPNCSYPDGQQLPDGSVVVVSDHDRTGKREISFVRFTEQDILNYAQPPKRKIISTRP